MASSTITALLVLAILAAILVAAIVAIRRLGRADRRAENEAAKRVRLEIVQGVRDDRENEAARSDADAAARWDHNFDGESP